MCDEGTAMAGVQGSVTIGAARRPTDIVPVSVEAAAAVRGDRQTHV